MPEGVFWVLELCVRYAQPVKFREVNVPVAFFTVLTQTELSDNVACRGTLYVFPGVSVIRYDRYVSFEDACHYCLNSSFTLLLHGRVGM